MIGNMTGETLEVSKLQAEIGVHKSTMPRVNKKEVLMLTNKNKISYPLKS